jgi:hypothetical protein
LQINVVYDSSVSNAPSAFTTDVGIAVQYLESLFTNPVTVTINVGYGEIAGQTMATGALGESEAYYIAENYSSVKNALIAQAAPGSSTLPTTSPFQGSVAMTTAEAKALGLMANNNSIDGYVGFASMYPFGYGNGITPASNQYYFIGVVEHEITEDLGRVSWLNYQPSYSAVIDLYRYSAPGVRDLTAGGAGSTAYFSVNNGTTNLGSWNNAVNNGDLADWYPSGPASGGNDAFNDYTSPGVVSVMSPNDITLMEALGWTGAPAISPPVVTATNQTAAYNQLIPLTSLFSITGSGITQYQVKISQAQGGAPLGTVTNNGTAIAANQWVTVSSLSALDYIGPAKAGKDEVWVQAYNGTWSNNPGAVITDQGLVAPVVTANNKTAASNQSIPLTSLFSVSGSGITEYQVWFSWAQAGLPPLGTVTNNGKPIATDQWVTVSSLSSLAYIGPAKAGKDEIWLQAYNGAWSNDPGVVITDTGSSAQHSQVASITQMHQLIQAMSSFSAGHAPLLPTTPISGESGPATVELSPNVPHLVR